MKFLHLPLFVAFCSQLVSAASNNTNSGLGLYPGGCLPGWTLGANNRCYLFFGLKYDSTRDLSYLAGSQMKAALTCYSVNARLAHIRSETDLNAVANLAKQYSSLKDGFWIDGNDITDPPYCWRTSDGQQFFTKWATGQPDHADNEETCALLKGQSQVLNFDAKCTKEYPFLCEYL